MCTRPLNHAGECSNDVEYREIKHHPFAEVSKNAAEQAKRGAIFLQSWTCDRCGAVQRMSQTNAMYTEGDCENCGHVTNLKQKGCNFTLLLGFRIPREKMRELVKAMGFTPPQDN